MAYILVRGVPGQAGVDVEGLDSAVNNREEAYAAIVELLGFTVGEGGIVSKKPGSFGRCDTLDCGKRVLVLHPYMYPTDVLNRLRESGFKVVSSAVNPSGTLVWTLDRH